MSQTGSLGTARLGDALAEEPEGGTNSRYSTKPDPQQTPQERNRDSAVRVQGRRLFASDRCFLPCNLEEANAIPVIGIYPSDSEANVTRSPIAY
jgi:hypothetical protein